MALLFLKSVWQLIRSCAIISHVYCLVTISQVESGAKLTEKQGTKISETLEVGFDWLMTGNEKKKMYPADRKMMDWLWEKEDVMSPGCRPAKNELEVPRAQNMGPRTLFLYYILYLPLHRHCAY